LNLTDGEVAAQWFLSYLAAMNFILHLWQSFLALHPWGYVATAVIALIAFIKKEAISAATSALSKEVHQYLPHWSKLTIEIREVCDDKILASIDASGYTVDLYVFLRVWAVNQKEVPTTVKEWTLTVVAENQKLQAERVADISRWHQHSKVKRQQHGFTVVEDVREDLNAFGNQPLQQGIPSEGWICFVLRGVEDSLLQGSTLRLTSIDSFGRKHVLKSKGPWNCKGSMVNREMLY